MSHSRRQAATSERFNAELHAVVAELVLDDPYARQIVSYLAPEFEPRRRR